MELFLFIHLDIFGFLALTIFSLLTLVYLLVVQVVLLRLLHGYRAKQKQKFIAVWEERVFNYLENNEKPELLIKKIQRRKYRYLLHYLREFLLMLKGDDFDRLSALINQTKIQPFLISRLKSGSPRKINEAAYFLGLAKSGAARNILRKKLRSQNASVFLSSALALARLNDIEVVFEIFRNAYRFKFVSKDSLLVIMSEFSSDICEVLLQNLKKEKNALIQSITITLFRHFKYYPAGEIVLKIAVYSQNKEVTIESIKYFTSIEFLKAANALRALINSPKAEIRAEVLKALAVLGDSSFEQRIWDRMYDSEYEVQYNAVTTLMILIPGSEEKISQFAYGNLKDRAAAIVRMVLSERSIKS